MKKQKSINYKKIKTIMLHNLIDFILYKKFIIIIHFAIPNV